MSPYPKDWNLLFVESQLFNCATFSPLTLIQNLKHNLATRTALWHWLNNCVRKLASLFQLNYNFLREGSMRLRLPLVKVISLGEKVIVGVDIPGWRVRVNFEVNKLISRHFNNYFTQFGSSSFISSGPCFLLGNGYVYSISSFVSMIYGTSRTWKLGTSPSSFHSQTCTECLCLRHSPCFP